MVRSRPLVIVSAAMSIDGKIATNTGQSNLSSSNDLIRIHKLRTSVDAILVGRNTIDVDDPMLNVRYAKGKNPIRIVLDPRGSISSNSKIVTTAKKIPTIIVLSENTNDSVAHKFVSKGIDIIKCGKKEIDVSKLLVILGEIGIKKVLIEGGGNTNWSFFKNHLVDQMIITISPCIIGGTTSTSFVSGQGFSNIQKSFKLKKIQKIQNELVLYYIS